MSLACIACHGVESPSHSFRSYSVSSSDNDGRCSAIASCLTRRQSLPGPPPPPAFALGSTSKVAPQPLIPITSNAALSGPPRLVRSCAISRDIVRDWNFEEVGVGH